MPHTHNFVKEGKNALNLSSPKREEKSLAPFLNRREDSSKNKTNHRITGINVNFESEMEIS